jgi:hypothetical protein
MNNVDVFGLYDFIAVKAGEKPRFVQVKTNGVALGVRKEISRFQERFLHPFCESVVLVFKKRKARWIVFRELLWL